MSVTWDVDPVIFHIGSLSLRWYSILFVAGLYPLGYYIMKAFLKRENVSIELMDPMLYALLIGTVAGARLGHVCFYDPHYYFAEHPEEILMVWRGGLASHGGAIGVLLAMVWLSRKYGKKMGFDLIWLLDRLVIPVCFAGMLIRLGNLFNSEIYGDPTNLPWGFIFVRAGETVAKHPTQLYEASCYLVIGLFLLLLYKKFLPSLKKGTLFGLFLILLFGARFAIEFIKEPQVAFEQNMSLDMGQWLSVPFILAGVVILVVSLVKGIPAASRNFVGGKGSTRTVRP